MKNFDGGDWSHWKTISMTEFAVYIQGKKVIGTVYGGPNIDCEGIALDDGSAMVALSQWYGPLSAITPDISAEEPTYYLGTKG